MNNPSSQTSAPPTLILCKVCTVIVYLLHHTLRTDRLRVSTILKWLIMCTTLFGISNCDTIKKAKKWLDANAQSYTFHDYRKQGLDSQWLANAEQQLGWETMLNKRGTTFRQLDAEVKENLDRDSAMALMSEQPAMIKRPILVHGSKMYIGFKESTYEEIFANE